MVGVVQHWLFGYAARNAGKTTIFLWYMGLIVGFTFGKVALRQVECAMESSYLT